MSLIEILTGNPLITVVLSLFLFVVALGAYKFIKDFLPW